MTDSDTTSRRVSPQALRAMLGDGQELALLDVREEGVFAKSHLLTAACLPLSRLELGLERRVPRRETRVVLCDDDESLAGRAAAAMRRFGWRDVSLLAGGVAAWKAAGHELFSGVYVPSKAFGEAVEHGCGTPRDHRRRAQGAPRRGRGRGGARLAADERVRGDEHSRRPRLPGSRAGRTACTRWSSGRRRWWW